MNYNPIRQSLRMGSVTKLHLLLILNFIMLLSSCSGQFVSHTAGERQHDIQSTTAIGDTVAELGKSIKLVYQDSKLNYWFASWENGLYRYDGKTIIHFTAKGNLPDNRIEDIKEDKSGNIYFNTSKGISKFDGQNFTTLTVTDSDNEWRLQPDDLWFKSALFPEEVYRYDGKFLYKMQFPKHPTYSNTYAVYCIYEDSKGKVWFGTNPLGVFRYNGKSIDWISEEDVAELHDGPANGVRSICEDKDGYFWFNSGYRYSVDENKNAGGGSDFSFTYKRETNIGSLDGTAGGDFNEYMSITKDNNNDLWIATYGGGVYRYDGKKLKHYPIIINSDYMTVFSIYNDRHGNLWLGTHEHGAYKYNGKTFEPFHL